jgi:hypothetical protein
MNRHSAPEVILFYLRVVKATKLNNIFLFCFAFLTTTECFIDLGKLNLFKISLPWSKSVKLTVVRVNAQTQIHIASIICITLRLLFQNIFFSLTSL